MNNITIENVSEWTIRILAAQCIFPRISSEKYYNDYQYQQDMNSLVEEGIGGFCVFQGTMGHVKSMVNVLQSIAKIPLLFCADYENGLPMRLDNGTSFPHAMALGKSGSSNNTYKAAKIIAKEAKSIGINWNLAPVCDINSNHENPIINIRSFGDDIETVNEHITAYIKGIHSENILSCAKHFPGHGDTNIDSHLALPVLNHNIETIKSRELQPFIQAKKSDVKSIMMAHLSVPNIDNSGLPASLSKNMIRLVREGFLFNGLILTDALDMKALTDNYSIEEIITFAFTAGNDILLLPSNPFEAIDILENFILGRVELQNSIIESVNRIMDAKKWCGLFDSKNNDDLELNFSEHERIALSGAYDALDCYGNTDLLPIKENYQIGGFAFLQNDDIEMPSMFYKILAQALENDCDFGFIDKNIHQSDLISLKHGIQNADIMIFTFFFKPAAYQILQIPEEIMKAYTFLSEGKKSIVILFGNPYLKDVINADLVISPYSDSLPSIAATILKLSGRKANLD